MLTLSVSFFVSAYGDTGIQLADVMWDRESYTLNDEAVIHVYDHDLNQNSNFKDTVTVDVWSDSDAGGFDLILIETGVNTGIFEEILYFVTSGSSDVQQKLLRVSDGDTIVAEYNDKTLPSTNSSTSFGDVDVSGVSKFTIVLTSKQTFSFANTFVTNSDGVKETLVKQDQNFSVTSKFSNLLNRDQFFVYSVVITDTNGQIIEEKEEVGTLSPLQSYSPTLSFSISQSGSYFIRASIFNDTIGDTGLLLSEIPLQIEKTQLEKLDDKKFVIGKVQWGKDNYGLADIPSIRITDEDMNINPNKRDSFTVDTWSDSDRGGLDVLVTETSFDSGVFEGRFSLSTTKESSNNILRVSSGDKITVNYDDITVPYSQSQNRYLEITADSYVEKNNVDKAMLPEWVRNIFVWYAEDRISEDELLRAIEFLIEQNIVKVGIS